MKFLQAVGILATVGLSVALVYAVGRIARWQAGRHDPIDALIRPPRWAKDGAAWMDTVDWQKADRASERRWQETLRAQRKTRKKVLPKPLRKALQLVKKKSA